MARVAAAEDEAVIIAPVAAQRPVVRVPQRAPRRVAVFRCQRTVCVDHMGYAAQVVPAKIVNIPDIVLLDVYCGGGIRVPAEVQSLRSVIRVQLGTEKAPPETRDSQ